MRLGDTTRRTFLAATAATVPSVALTGPAHAESLPDYAPAPASALGPPMNDLGYHVGRIKGNLYWVTDSNHPAMNIQIARQATVQEWT